MLIRLRTPILLIFGSGFLELLYFGYRNQPDDSESDSKSEDAEKHFRPGRNTGEEFHNGTEYKSQNYKICRLGVFCHGVFQELCGKDNSLAQPEAKWLKDCQPETADRPHNGIVYPHQEEQIGDADSRQYQCDCCDKSS